MFLAKDCTEEDVVNATTEVLYNTFYKSLYEYPDNIILYISSELCVRGL